MSTKLLNMREVGERLGHGYHWFRKRRHAMQKDQGFPEPVRTCGLRWDPRAIDAWIAGQGAPRVTVDPKLGAIDFATVLDNRAEKIAERMH